MFSLKMQAYKKAALLLFILVFFSCAGAPPAKLPETAPEAGFPAPPEKGKAEEGKKEKSETVIPPPQTVAPPDSLTIIAAGDNLYHPAMIKDGENGEYESAYSEIRPLVEKADIGFVNQETLLAGADFGFSGYPKFNTPQKVGRALAAVGFNVVNHASNHIMDKGEKAVFATMNFWDTIPQVKVLGIHRSQEERDLPGLMEKNNIRVGFLSYTYGTNNLPVPADKPYLVSLINTETMAKEIDALRPLCDFLVVSMHWGEEYQFAYDKNQATLAAFLAEHKVDLVLGHHPHVIQPIVNIARPDGGNMLCFYSLGNLISAQTQNSTLLGALAYIRIEKKTGLPGEAAAGVTVMEAGAIPIVTHYEKDYTGFKVYPLYAYTGELLEKHWKNQTKTELTMDYLNGLAATVLGDKEILKEP